ncbi:unnamed protein product [Heligmosomoides polygyrus]|uniref:Uncharacterized protein n=1 Tax=Heligmosomoides polygyrus TaxID=6339 RepID=A0A183GJS0_HELPZ|nr:unnamed protein product [Heligmosomoides polygyrus]
MIGGVARTPEAVPHFSTAEKDEKSEEKPRRCGRLKQNRGLELPDSGPHPATAADNELLGRGRRTEISTIFARLESPKQLAYTDPSVSRKL